MTHDEIEAHAERAYPGQAAFQAYMLARWGAYGDPANVPAGWAVVATSTSETGIRQLATDAAGELYNDAPARRIPWTCPQGTTHRRYWRSLHRPGRPAMVACEHAPEAQELPR